MAQSSIDAAPEVRDLAGTEIEEPDFFDDQETAAVARPKPKNPAMDPSSPRWNPKQYFAAQPRVIIVIKRTDSDILSDPSGTQSQVQPVSINGYEIKIVKGQPTRVPQDFADYLVEIGAAYRYSDIPDVSEM